tara:strand:+ start:35347 stop:37791 length:2445 start_codon:yes stop_codon:yes gene_type:complete
MPEKVAGSFGSALQARLAPVDLQAAYFYAHSIDSAAKREPLGLDEFNVTISTSLGTIRTRIDAVIRNPSKEQRQARIRVPIPSNAAVTEAVLFVGEVPMRGAFLEAKRAERVYKSYTQRRRDPLLAVWSGPDWVDLQIFPVEGEKTRRFQLEWVEPLGSAGELHALPMLANSGERILSQGVVVVDGSVVDPEDGAVALNGYETMVSSKRPGEAFGYVLAKGERPSGTSVVLIAETSAAMTLSQRAKQREDIESLLASLPATARVTLLSADWLTKELIVDKSPNEAMASLPLLDDVISAGLFDIGNTFVNARASAKDIGAGAIVLLGHGRSGFGDGDFSTPIPHLRREGIALFYIASEQPFRGPQAIAMGTKGRTLRATDPKLVSLLRGDGVPPAIEGVEGWEVLKSVREQPDWIGRFVGTAPEAAKPGRGENLAALWERSQVAARIDAPPATSSGNVLTPTTSILVLESEAEYRRWGIRAPAAIVEQDATVERGVAQNQNMPDVRLVGVAAVEGKMGVRSAQVPGGSFASLASDRDVFGGLMGNEVGEVSGGWGHGISGRGAGRGTIGTGQYGIRSHGSGAGAGGVPAPNRLLLGNATVRGGLDKALVRRYVRRKLARLRYCFDKQHVISPLSKTAMTLRFQIAPDGSVPSVSIQKAPDAVMACITTAVRSIRFPKPKSAGFVIVEYPIVFEPGEVAQAPQAEPGPMALALGAFLNAESGSGASLVAEMLDTTLTSPAMLAWWILKEKARSDAKSKAEDGALLAAALLYEAGDDWDSRRVFSQAGSALSSAAGQQFRSMGFAADIDRLTANAAN